MSQFLLSALGIVCPTCDELNPPRATVCVNCTAALLDGPPAAKPPPARAPEPAAPVRKPTSTSLPVIPPPARPGSPGSPGSPATKPPAAPIAGRTGPAPVSSFSRPPVPEPAPSPPGMRPVVRPPVAPSFSEPPVPDKAPIPASELVRRPPAVAPVTGRFVLVVLAGANAGQRYRLAGTTCQFGRTRGKVLLPEDPYVSPLHATFLVKEGRLFVRDDNSASGTFIGVYQEMIPPGALFSAGHRLFRYAGALEPAPLSLGRPIAYGAPVPQSQAVYMVEELLVGNRPGRAVVTVGALLTIGQTLCDLSYPDDRDLATRHCELSPTPTGALLRDLSGGLGTFVRLSAAERALHAGDRVRIGEQLLQVEAVA